MQVGLRVRPVPHRDHGVALDALRPLRLRRRQLALGDAVGPIAEHLQGALRAHAVHGVDHVEARLPGLDAAGPGLVAILELAERLGDRARRLVAELVASDAAVGLDEIEGLGLRLYFPGWC